MARRESHARWRVFGLLAVLVVCLGIEVSPAVALPDGRGYEMVSPPQKNGGDVMVDTARVRVANDGGAVEYSSLTGFGDTLGGGVATEYMAVRGPGGWLTHGIMPPQPALSFQAITAGLDPGWMGDLSPDLSSGVVRAWRPLTDEDPNVAEISNLYVRHDLRTPGPGSYQLTTPCPLCVTAFPTGLMTHRPIFIDADDDYGKILFESDLNLAPGASGGLFKLYEWDHGTLSLAGILPDGRPALESGAGNGTVASGATYTHASISNDGSKVFFTATVGGVRNIYMRVDGTTTVQLNVSESGPVGPGTAHYWDASADGSRVFFSAPQGLTRDTASGGLYMYDTTKPDSAPDNLTFLSPDNEPSDNFSPGVRQVAGASADGETVYFVDNSQLAPGGPAPTDAKPLFVWRDGKPLAYVHMLTLDDEGKFSFDASGGLSGKYSTVSPSGDLVYLSDEPVGPDSQDHGSCPLHFTGACWEVYVYTAATGELRCASCSPDGTPPPTGGDALTMLQHSVGGSARPDHLNRPISDDGRRVFFTTPAALVPQDVNGKKDAYEYDVPTGTVSLISSGRDSGDSFFLESSPSGDDVMFATREQLVGWDRDNNYDLYDARVGGGFPEPPPVQTVCDGDACKGPLTTAPDTDTNTSSTFTGAGNAKATLKHHTRHKKKPRCRKGTVRKHVHGKTKCVKRRARR